MQGGRHLPSAHERPVAQSLVSEQPVAVAVVALVQAGTASAPAKRAPASQATSRRWLDRAQLRVTSFVMAP
jgi:hypothetical protein